MRVSVDRDDPAYDMALSQKVKEVTLNGEVIKFCVTADEQEGFVICYVANEEGKPAIDNRSGSPETIMHRGFVRIHWKEDP